MSIPSKIGEVVIGTRTKKSGITPTNIDNLSFNNTDSVGASNKNGTSSIHLSRSLWQDMKESFNGIYSVPAATVLKHDRPDKSDDETKLSNSRLKSSKMKSSSSIYTSPSVKSSSIYTSPSVKISSSIYTSPAEVCDDIDTSLRPFHDMYRHSKEKAIKYEKKKAPDRLDEIFSGDFNTVLGRNLLTVLEGGKSPLPELSLEDLDAELEGRNLPANTPESAHDFKNVNSTEVPNEVASNLKPADASKREELCGLEALKTAKSETQDVQETLPLTDLHLLREFIRIGLDPVYSIIVLKGLREQLWKKRVGILSKRYMQLAYDSTISHRRACWRSRKERKEREAVRKAIEGLLSFQEYVEQKELYIKWIREMEHKVKELSKELAELLFWDNELD